MANLKGKGSMTAVNLLAKTFDNNVTKDGKTRFIDVQVDHRDERGRTQTNLHLTSERTKDDQGKTRFNNGAPYSAGQFDKIVETAGPNVEPIYNKAGDQEIGKVYAVKASVMPSTKGNGLVLNSETLEQSDFKVDSKTMDGQFASMKAAKEAAAEAKAAAPEQSAEAPAPEETVEAEEPAVG